jgi:hydroxymethylbilane synthase
VLAAVPPRHDPRDALVTRAGRPLDELPEGSRLGTGSPRRRSQVLHARPDLAVEPLRGNVDTRVGHVVDGRLDAVVLAVAGLERLGLDRAPWVPLEPSVCLPAVGQGALALQVREDDPGPRGLVGRLDDAESHAAVECERAFLAELEGGCLAPATAWARVEDGELRIDAMVADNDGRTLLREDGRCPVEGGEEAGRTLARRLLDRGAGDLLQQAREG